MRHVTTTLILLGLIIMVAGCNILSYPLYVLFGEQQKTVKAEYSGLAGARTAIVVAVGPATEFEHPMVRSNLALASAYEIGREVKGATFVDQQAIERFQQEDLDWFYLPVLKIGQRFEAQRVLYLDIIEFTLEEENSVNLLRGRVTADVRVYDMADAKPDEPVYQTEVSVMFPTDNPVPMADMATRAILENQTVGEFAKALVKKFHDHKEPK
ncbi:MAG: hypothetical protein JW709_04660 [Sedimentisphaerales bacterium]|nr:hypothetical protein [Sedimentisphaerales bacterium]